MSFFLSDFSFFLMSADLLYNRLAISETHSAWNHLI